MSIYFLLVALNFLCICCIIDTWAFLSDFNRDSHIHYNQGDSLRLEIIDETCRKQLEARFVIAIPLRKPRDLFNLPPRSLRLNCSELPPYHNIHLAAIPLRLRLKKTYSVRFAY